MMSNSEVDDPSESSEDNDDDNYLPAQTLPGQHSKRGKPQNVCKCGNKGRGSGGTGQGQGRCRGRGSGCGAATSQKSNKKDGDPN